MNSGEKRIPINLTGELADLRRLATATRTYGEIHQDDAQHRHDDGAEEQWLWVAATGHRLLNHLDRLEQHLVKIGIVPHAEPR